VALAGAVALEIALSIELVYSADIPDSPRSAIQADTLALFDDVGPVLYRYLRSRGLTEDAADDVVQETFLALFRHLSLGRPRHNLRGWIFEVGRRLASKQRVRALRRLDVEVPWRARVAAAAIDPGATPEAQVLADQRRSRLQRVVRALPERDRQCLLLRAEGLQYRDIAQALGVSLGGVAKALARALGRIAHSEGQE
jgi:RNA polymerase sigma-70 factor (ECF subfamily)